MKGLIIKAISGDYSIILPDQTIIVCKPLGIFRHNKTTPKVGDYVSVENNIITNIFPRKNDLIRPFVANVDKVFIVTSIIQPDLNFNLLDRIISQVEFFDITAVLIFTKLDIGDITIYQDSLEYYKKLGYHIYFAPEDKELIKKEIKDCITVLAGQSGVGKSTLVNLFDNFNIKTNSISLALGRGKHTTTHNELLKVNEGWIADTPGFGTLDLDMDLVSLSHTFKDFFACQCKYSGCLHLQEPGCAVKKAVAEGQILASRYQNYLTFVSDIKKKKPKY